MTGKDIDEKLLWERVGIKLSGTFFIITAALSVIAGVMFALAKKFVGMYTLGMTLFAIFIMLAAISLFFAVGIGGMGLSSRNRINSYIKAHGKEKIMAEIRDAIYVYEQLGKPVTVFCRTFIYDKDYRFIDIDDIDLVYGYQKGTYYKLKVFFKNGKETEMCTGLDYKSEEAKRIFSILYSYNKGILLGYTSNNLKAHKERVRLYKNS